MSGFNATARMSPLSWALSRAASVPTQYTGDTILNKTTGRMETPAAPSTNRLYDTVLAREQRWGRSLVSQLHDQSVPTEVARKIIATKKLPRSLDEAGQTTVKAGTVASQDDEVKITDVDYVVALLLQTLATFYGEKINLEKTAQKLTEILLELSEHDENTQKQNLAVLMANQLKIAPEEALQIVTVIYALKNKDVSLEDAQQALATVLQKFIEASEAKPSITVEKIRESNPTVRDIEVKGKKTILSLGELVSVEIVSHPNVEDNNIDVNFYIYSSDAKEVNKLLNEDLAVIHHNRLVNGAFKLAEGSSGFPLRIKANVDFIEGVTATNEKGQALIEVYYEGQLYRFWLPVKKQRVGF